MTYLVDARLVEQVTPSVQCDPALDHELSSDRLEHEVDDDLGVLVQALEDAAEETLGLEDVGLEADVTGGKERYDQEDEKCPDVGFGERVEGRQAAESSLVKPARHLKDVRPCGQLGRLFSEPIRSAVGDPPLATTRSIQTLCARTCLRRTRRGRCTASGLPS